MLRRAVQFEILLDGELFFGRALQPDQPLRLGPEPSCEIPTSLLRATLQLLTPHHDGYGLRLAPPLSGRIIARGRSLRVCDGLLCDPRPEPLRLVEGDTGELQLGAECRLRFQVIPAISLGAWRPRLEPRLALSLAGSSVAAALLLLSMWRLEPPTPTHRAREIRLRSRPALVDLSRLRRAPPASTPGRRLAAAHQPTRARSLSGRARTNQRGLLGLMDHHLGRPTAVRRGHDPLAAADRLLASTEHLLASSASGRVASSHVPDRLGDWLPSGMDPAAGFAAARLLTRPRLASHFASKPRGTSSASGPGREAIREVVMKGAAGVRLCYERELLSNPEPRQGKLLLRWRIDETGHATDLEIVKDSVRLEGLQECVIRQVKSWMFPPCPGSCEVTYPFEFHARS